MADLPTLRLTRGNLRRLSVRQWGFPTGLYIGRAWRTEQRDGSWTVSVVAPGGTPETVRVVTRAVGIVDRYRRQRVPAEVVDALRAYAERWPHSAPGLRGLGVARG